MIVAEYWMPRSAWPPGPWQNEPDRVQWRDRGSGLDCLALRQHGGFWCGYVAMPPGHPWHGADFDDVKVVVHGGLTFAAPCMTEGDHRERVCHLVLPGDPDDVWWLGFDSAHGGDLMPFMAGLHAGDTYRTIGYVTGQCELLAYQARRAER